jgi:hypothetical protein
MGIGFIACPCHLPLTLPLLLSLTAGTAISAWLSDNTTLVYAASTILFLGGFVLAAFWLTTDADRSKRQVPGTVETLTDTNGELIADHDCVACNRGHQSV